MDSDYLGQASDKDARAILIYGISKVRRSTHFTCAINELEHKYGSTVLWNVKIESNILCQT